MGDATLNVRRAYGPALLRVCQISWVGALAHVYSRTCALRAAISHCGNSCRSWS